MIEAAVVVVSDSVFEGRRTDGSGPAVKELLEARGFRVESLDVVPDEDAAIGARLKALTEDRSIAVFTSGGTGVAARDVTPEATRRVIEREIPGFGERMRATGRKATPLADLSRALAGVRGRSLIVNLPGSPRGAVESLDAIVELVPHVMDLLRGKTEHRNP